MASWCPLGSESEATTQPPAEVLAAQVVAADPIDDVTNDQHALGVSILWGVVSAGVVVSVVLFALYVYARRHPGVKQCFRRLDCAFATKHYVADGEPLVRRDKAIGGFATVATLVAMTTLVVAVYVNAVYLPVYDGAMSPIVPPFFPTGLVTLTVRYYGVSPTACAATMTVAVTVADGAAFGSGGGGGGSSMIAPAYDPSQRLCTTEWQCVGVCTLGVATVAFTAGSTDAAAYATAIAWQLDFPAFAGVAPTTDADAATTRRFRLSGAIAPPSADLVLQNSAVAAQLPAVTVSHIPVVVTKPDGAQLVGSLAQVAASDVSADAFVNQTQYSAAASSSPIVTTTATTRLRVGLTVTIQPSTLVYAVKGTPVNRLYVVGTCASYVTGVSLAMALLMVFFESCFPKHGPNGFRVFWRDTLVCLGATAMACGICCRVRRSCRDCIGGGAKTMGSRSNTKSSLRLDPDESQPATPMTIAAATTTASAGSGAITIEMLSLEPQTLAA
jgi:hypothetical protein